MGSSISWTHFEVFAGSNFSFHLSSLLDYHFPGYKILFWTFFLFLFLWLVVFISPCYCSAYWWFNSTVFWPDPSGVRSQPSFHFFHCMHFLSCFTACKIPVHLSSSVIVICVCPLTYSFGVIYASQICGFKLSLGNNFTFFSPNAFSAHSFAPVSVWLQCTRWMIFLTVYRCFIHLFKILFFSN